MTVIAYSPLRCPFSEWSFQPGRFTYEGQMQTKQFTTAEAARKEHDKLVADSGGWTTQLLNGYRGRDNTCHESHRLKMKKVVPIKA